MKQGKSLVEMAQELQRIQQNAKDFVVPTEKLSAKVIDPSPGFEKGEIALSFTNGKTHDFSLTKWSASQLAGYAEIPKPYFDRIRVENPLLCIDSINHGLDRQIESAKKQGKPEHRMVRTLDGRVRGLLSSKYRILDAHDMFEAVAPTMLDSGMQVVSSEITESRLFIKALAPKIQGEVKKGDVVQFGLTISTSDVGAGSVRVEPLMFRLVCANGLIMNTAIRKFHVGRNQAENDIRELLSDRTRELSDAAFWHEVRDIVIASMKPENFERQLDRLRIAANEEIKNFDLPRVVELSMKATGITGEGKKNSILHALASGNEGAGMTRWGLVNAFTRAAQDDDVSYEESIEMERAGGQILELSKRDWSSISAVAQ